jgi:hypothetical protein
MFVSRILSIACFLSLGVTLTAQGVFSATKSGSWNDPTVWSLDSGSDADGIPDADDDASSVDYEISVSTTEEVNNFTIESVTGHRELEINTGSLTVYGDLTLTNPPAVFSWFTVLRIYSGDIIIHGDLIYDNPQNSPSGGVQILNNGVYTGLERNFEILGDLNTNLSNNFIFRIFGDTDDAVDLKLTSGTDQEIIGNRPSNRGYSKIFVENGTTLHFFANSDAPLVYDSIKVNNGSIYLDDVSMAKIDEFENQITVASGCKITVVDDIPFPDHEDSGANGNVTDMQAGSTSEFIIGASFDVDVLGGTGFNYRDVVFKGSGTKTMTNNVGGGASDAAIEDLTLEAGTLIVDATVTDISDISGTITVKSGATLQIDGNPTMPDATQFVLEDGSKVIYASTSAQDILGGLTYYDLEFSGTGAKTTGAAFSVNNEISFSTDLSTLNVNHDITLESDASGTAFVSEIPTGYSFVYGGGDFVCERYFTTTALDYFNASENYRDFSLPLINSDATLDQFDDDNPAAGPNYFSTLVELPIFGVTGSKYPGDGSSSNVSDFNSTSGAFGIPGSYTQSIVLTAGGAITTNAVRFGWSDDDGLTIKARGEINTGDIDFNVEYSVFFNSYNLVGNPYPCAIDFEQIVASNSEFVGTGNGISQTFYVIGPDQFGANVMGFYNAFTNTGDASRYIPAFQGFMLEVNHLVPGSSSDFTISESHKVAEDYDTYKSDNEEPSPELMSIKVFENNAVKDKIHFYFFEGGTNSYEEVLDVKKVDPKVTALQGARLDFFDGKKKLNLIANATTDKKDLNLQFVVENPEANNVAIELTNLSSLLNTYNCIYVENNRTGEIHNVSGDFLTINVGTVSEEIYTIKSVSTPELFQVTATDATCFGYEDGILRADMSNLPVNTPVTVYKNNLEFDAFNSNETNVYKRSVGAGSYEFKISGISETCTYVYREEIKDTPEVISNFEISDSLFTNKEIVFTSTSNNTTINEWFTSTNETFYGQNLKMTYATPGKYWVKLTAIGDYENCRDEELKFFEVQQSETSVGVTENNNVFSEVVVSTINQDIIIRQIPEKSTLELLSADGKLIKTIQENNGIATFASLTSGSYIIRITNNQQGISYHIGVK